MKEYQTVESFPLVLKGKVLEVESVYIND